MRGAPRAGASSLAALSLLILSISVAGPALAAKTCHGNGATKVGTAKADVLRGTAGDDVIVGLGGNDVITGLDGFDIVCAGPGNDKVSGGSGVDQLYGDDGNDTIRGDVLGSTSRFDPDQIEGGDGNDVLHGDGGDEQAILGGKGDDMLFGDAGDDKLFNNPGLLGGPGVDLVDGGPGDDVIEGGDGGDTLIGGAGDDGIAYTKSPAAVTIQLGGNLFLGGDAKGDSIPQQDVEGVIGSRHNDTLTGSAQEDFFAGSGGSDLFDGGPGDDRFEGNGLLGGSGQDGIDLITYQDSPGPIAATAGANGFVQPVQFDCDGNSINPPNTALGVDQVISVDGVIGTDGCDGIYGFEVAYGGGSRDTLRGSLGADRLYGQGGDDNLEGFDDDDLLDGGIGDNANDGGPGDDTCLGSTPEKSFNCETTGPSPQPASRSITLQLDKTSYTAGDDIQITGTVTSNKPACANLLFVDVEFAPATDPAAFETVTSTSTNSAGAFSTSDKASASGTYRAVLGETVDCAAATSPGVNVTVATGFSLTGPRFVERGARFTLTVSNPGCETNAEVELLLKREGHDEGRVASGNLGSDCKTTFKQSIREDTTYRARVPGSSPASDVYSDPLLVSVR